MKICIAIGMMLVLVACASPEVETTNEAFTHLEQTSWKVDESPHSMALGVGDEITINIWRHNELNRNVKIDMAGNIYLPLVGEIYTAHLTINDLRQELNKAYSQYIVNPHIDINPITITSKKFIILGEIQSPGNYPLASEIGIIDAIAAAGGTTRNANENVLLIRRSQGKAQIFIASLDINNFMDTNMTEKDLEKNIMVANTKIFHQDILYIPQSSIADIEEFMQRLNNIIAPLLSIQRSFILWPETIDAINGSNGNVIIAN